MTAAALIENAFARFSGRPLLEDGTRTLSYADVEERTRRLGNWLAARCGADGGTAGTVMGNVPELVEVDLSCARFGIVRTMLNVRASPEDHAYCLDKAGCRVVFFDADLAAAVDGLRARLAADVAFVAVGGPAPDWAVPYEAVVAEAAEDPPAVVPRPADRHSVYFTSGTTGRPKGVVLTQANWVTVTTAYLVDYSPDTAADDVALLAAPITHATGSLVLPHMARGARCRVVRRFEPEEVLRCLVEEGVTATFMAPTMVMMLLDRCGPDLAHRLSLKALLYGGAAFPTERLKEALAVFGPVFRQLYGQWESPVAFTSLSPAEHVEALDRAPHRLASAGRPAFFARVAIMDDDGRLLPPDTDGEIVTSGPHLMEGYLDDEEATAEIREGPWQRTGDIGRLDGEGFLYITDRKKDMIITGGNNVYPRQVEEVLYAHPDVQELSVIGRPDPLWGETVHAVVVPRPGAAFDPDAFLAWARERLPTDRRPRSVDVVAELPKSHYGKILKREVRALHGAAPAEGRPASA